MCGYECAGGKNKGVSAAYVWTCRKDVGARLGNQSFCFDVFCIGSGKREAAYLLFIIHVSQTVSQMKTSSPWRQGEMGGSFHYRYTGRVLGGSVYTSGFLRLQSEVVIATCIFPSLSQDFRCCIVFFLNGIISYCLVLFSKSFIRKFAKYNSQKIYPCFSKIVFFN